MTTRTVLGALCFWALVFLALPARAQFVPRMPPPICKIDATPLDTGTATAGGASTLTDTAKSWTTDQYAGERVTLRPAGPDTEYRSIASNTATVLTVTAAWTVQPSASDPYEIQDADIQRSPEGLCGCPPFGTCTEGTLITVDDALAGGLCGDAQGGGTAESICQRRGSAWIPAEGARARYVDDANCSVFRLYESGLGWDPSPEDGCGDRTVIRDGHVVQVPDALDDETVRGTPTPSGGSTSRRGIYDALLARYLPLDEYEDCLADASCNPLAKAFLDAIHPRDRGRVSREITFFGAADLIDGSCGSAMCQGWNYYQTGTTVAHGVPSAADWYRAQYTVGTTANDGFSICAPNTLRVRDVIASDGDSGMHGGHFEVTFKIDSAANADMFLGFSSNGCTSDLWGQGGIGVDAIGLWMQNRETWAVVRANSLTDFSATCAACTSKKLHCTGGVCRTYPAARTVSVRFEVTHHYGVIVYWEGEVAAIFGPSETNLDITSTTYSPWYAFRKVNTAGAAVGVHGLKVGADGIQ